MQTRQMVLARYRQISRGQTNAASRRRSGCIAALVAVVLLSGWPAGEAAAQPGGLFTIVSSSDAAIGGVAPVASDRLTLRRRLVTIDLRQLVPATDSAARGALAGIEIASRGVLMLNLFEDAVFTGLVERTTPTFSGGQALSGRLAGIEMGTLTLVVNGDVVAGTVRTPEATYRIRPAGNGLHAVSQIDPSQLPPLAEPIPRQRLGDDGVPFEFDPGRIPVPR